MLSKKTTTKHFAGTPQQLPAVSHLQDEPLHSSALAPLVHTEVEQLGRLGEAHGAVNSRTHEAHLLRIRYCLLGGYFTLLCVCVCVCVGGCGYGCGCGVMCVCGYGCGCGVMCVCGYGCRCVV